MIRNDKYHVNYVSERLAFQLIKREDELKAQKKRYEKLVNDLNEEQDFWVTENNIESKIIPDLFRDVATTGLVTPYSHFWRQQALTFHEKRILSPEMENRISIRNPEDVALFEADKENQKVEAMESFLDGFVQTGEDRQKLRSIAKNIMSHDIELPELDIVHSTVSFLLHFLIELMFMNYFIVLWTKKRRKLYS